jgi:VWFA-related protein
MFLLAQASPGIAPDAEVRALTIMVTDKEGAPVEGLGLADVSLSENGLVRDITSFRPDTRPLSVAIVMDTSGVVGADYRLNVVDAVSAFVARLPSGTTFALWGTGDRPTKLVDYTEDPAEASKALLRVAPQGGNYVLDALAEASKDLKEHAREGDRTAVVAISGTGPELSYVDKWAAAAEAEENADLFLLLQVDVGGADFQMRADLAYVFNRLAKATAGEYDVILSYQGVDAGLRKLDRLLTAGYRIAYATVPELEKREIEVTVALPGSHVRVPVRTDVESELAPEL